MKTISEEKYEFTLPNKMTLIFHDKETAEWLQGLIDGNDEAVRLLKRARWFVKQENDACIVACAEDPEYCCADTLTAIDAYLAKRNES